MDPREVLSILDHPSCLVYVSKPEGLRRIRCLQSSLYFYHVVVIKQNQLCFIDNLNVTLCEYKNYISLLAHPDSVFGVILKTILCHYELFIQRHTDVLMHHKLFILQMLQNRRLM